MKTKLEQFIIRNRKRNAHLYDDTLINGQDYIICPVSNERLSMIKSSYITNILKMTVEEYDLLYPGIRGVSLARIHNIKTGLKQIDNSTGLTKYELSQVKAREKLSKIDDNGVSGYKKKGQKTKQTHMNTIDEYGRNGYRRQADARLTTILPNGLTVEQNAHIKQKETLCINNTTGTGGASKISKKILAPLLELLKDNNIKFYFDKEEYGIKDTDSGNFYFWDLTIPEFKITIEYQSLAWHADPTISDEQWNAWKPPRGKIKTAVEVLEYDYNKARSIYKHRGFVTYYVWERNHTQDIEDILCLLKTMIMKY